MCAVINEEKKLKWKPIFLVHHASYIHGDL